jgi:hypothetical protein
VHEKITGVLLGVLEIATRSIDWSINKPEPPALAAEIKSFVAKQGWG